jgi:hypothetical protein
VTATLEIMRLKARRDHALDMRDWATYETLHIPAHYSHAEGFAPWTSTTEMIAQVSRILEGVVSVHHSHSPNITFQARDKATGVWAMEDNLSWKQGDEDHWLRGFGFYTETYEKRNGKWLIASRRLKRLRVDMSPGARFGPDGIPKPA